METILWLIVILAVSLYLASRGGKFLNDCDNDIEELKEKK